MLIFALALAAQPNPALPQPEIRPDLEPLADVFRADGAAVAPASDGFVATRGAVTVTVSGAITCPAPPPAPVLPAPVPPATVPPATVPAPVPPAPVPPPSTTTGVAADPFTMLRLRAVNSSGGEVVFDYLQQFAGESCAASRDSPHRQRTLEAFRDEAWTPKATPTLRTLIGAALSTHGKVRALTPDERARWQVGAKDKNAFVVVVKQGVDKGAERQLLVTGAVTCAKAKPKKSGAWDLTVSARITAPDEASAAKKGVVVVGQGRTTVAAMPGADCTEARLAHIDEVQRVMRPFAKTLLP